MRQMQVYELVDENFMEEKGLKVTKTRWVIVNKGDAKSSDSGPPRRTGDEEDDDA